jgi:serine/threonine-protein kinase
VYRARDPNLDREVAIKVLRAPQTAAEKAQFPERFRREAVALAKLRHPHIVAVYDCDLDAATGIPYVVMELVAGGTLASLLAGAGGKLPIARAVHIAAQMAEALAFAHGAGIVHRDVKPDNVIVEANDWVRLIDFGVARVTESELTVGEYVLGTPSYLSPEAARSKPIDARADQFSLATVMVEMLTGKRVFRGETPDETLRNICVRAVPSLAELGVVAPAALEALLVKMHAKDPAARIQSDAELVAQLTAASRQLR